MKIVIALADRGFADLLRLAFEARDVVAQVEADGRDLAFLAADGRCAALVMDPAALPFGLDDIRALRARGLTLPILVVSRKHHIEDKVEALRAGADDYMVPPVHYDEVLARLRAMVRRANGILRQPLQFGPLSLDLDRQVVTVCGQRIVLSRREYDLLEVLALKAPAVVSKDHMLSALYGGRDEPGHKILDVFICRLRRKFSAAGGDGLIETIWGRGYALRLHGVAAVSQAA